MGSQPHEIVVPEEGDSSGNVSRGDRTPIELFLAGIASWEPHVERLLLAA
jgi:hypothetical protein